MEHCDNWVSSRSTSGSNEEDLQMVMEGFLAIYPTMDAQSCQKGQQPEAALSIEGARKLRGSPEL